MASYHVSGRAYVAGSNIIFCLSALPRLRLRASFLLSLIPRDRWTFVMFLCCAKHRSNAAAALFAARVLPLRNLACRALRAYRACTYLLPPLRFRARAPLISADASADEQAQIAGGFSRRAAAARHGRVDRGRQ